MWIFQILKWGFGDSRVSWAWKESWTHCWILSEHNCCNFRVSDKHVGGQRKTFKRCLKPRWVRARLDLCAKVYLLLGLKDFPPETSKVDTELLRVFLLPWDNGTPSRWTQRKTLPWPAYINTDRGKKKGNVLLQSNSEGIYAIVTW